jgi:MFS family permease
MVVGFGIGLIVTVGNIALNTMFQQEIPLDVMGRVYAVMGAVCTAAIPLGQMLFGFLFDKIDAWICVTLSAAILLTTILSFKKSLCNQENGKVETCLDNEELNVNMLEIANIVDNESGEI